MATTHQNNLKNIVQTLKGVQIVPSFFVFSFFCFSVCSFAVLSIQRLHLSFNTTLINSYGGCRINAALSVLETNDDE